MVGCCFLRKLSSDAIEDANGDHSMRVATHLTTTTTKILTEMK